VDVHVKKCASLVNIFVMWRSWLNFYASTYIARPKVMSLGYVSFVIDLLSPRSGQICGWLRGSLTCDMDKVDIFLVDNNYGTPFLSIPKRDIQRLTIYPHKSLRFVLSAICGAHGQLSATLKGPPVHDDAGFTDLCTAYYIRLMVWPWSLLPCCPSESHVFISHSILSTTVPWVRRRLQKLHQLYTRVDFVDTSYVGIASVL
jgi:hypothetical protein